MTDKFSQPLTKLEANAVYDVLVEHGEALEINRGHFIHTQTTEFCSEYRFGGIASGAKFRRNRHLAWNGKNSRWYCDYYQEAKSDVNDFAFLMLNMRLELLSEQLLSRDLFVAVKPLVEAVCQCDTEPDEYGTDPNVFLANDPDRLRNSFGEIVWGEVCDCCNTRIAMRNMIGNPYIK
jgi:hypothetical protein